MNFQGSLLSADRPELGPLDGLRRTTLGHGAWVDVLPGWVRGADALFERLADGVDWRAEQREMYERVVAVPRLLAYFGEGDVLPDPVLAEMRAELSARYGAELGEPFVTAGLCLYRDGNDSVAWHGDRIGRGRSADTMVAIVSVGEPRALALRPAAWGRGVGPVRARARGPAGDGWLLPADLGPRRAEDRPPGRAADQHPVPPRGVN